MLPLSDPIYSKEHLFDEKSASNVFSVVENLPPVRRRRLYSLVIAIFGVLVTTLFVLFSDTSSCGPSPIVAQGLFKPTMYEVVPGFFAQSLNSTNDATFDFVWTLFSLC